MRVFVSHAGQDKDACAKLLKELGRQDVEYFDYTKPYEETEVGARLDSRMRDEIARSDLVVAMVSKHSANPEKKIVLAEIHDAIELGFLERRRLIAVQFRDPKFRPPYWIRFNATALRTKLARTRQSGLGELLEDLKPLSLHRAYLGGNPLNRISGWHYDGDIFVSLEDWELIEKHEDRSLVEWLKPETSRCWFGPFSRLQSRAWAHFDDVVEADFSYVAKLVCNRLGQSFKPPAPEDDRLPLFVKLRNEIWDLPQFIRQSALHLVDEFFDYTAIGDWEEAIVTLRAFKGVLKKNNIDAYFPKVVEGLCYFRLGRLDLAERAYQDAADAGSPSGADENVSGGLSKIFFEKAKRQPDPRKRAEHYEEALELNAEAIKKILERKDDDFGPNTRMDRLVMYVQVLQDEVARQLASGRLNELLENAKTDAANLSEFEPEERQFEDHLKWRHLLAMTKLIEGQKLEAWEDFEAILEEPLGDLKLGSENFGDFPGSLGNHLLAELADVGIFLDEGTTESLALRARGTAEDFILMDDSIRGFRFVRLPEPKGEKSNRHRSYAIYSVDAQVTLRCFELRSELDGRATEENLTRFEERAATLGNPDLLRHVLIGWNEFDQPERAVRVLDDLDPKILSEHPQLLVDRAELARAFGEGSKKQEALKQFRMLCLQHLQQELTSSGYSGIDLIQLLAQSFEIDGANDLSQILSEALARLNRSAG